MRYYLGIDLGATNCKYALVDENYHIIRSGLESVKLVSLPFLFLEFCSRLLKICNKYQPVALGIGLPGLVDFKKGYIYKLTHLKGWEELNFREIAEKKLKLPVIIDNDVNMATIGEKYRGAGIKYNNFIMVTLGTGVGGGLFLDGRLYRGKDFSAGEIGHMPISPQGPNCVCGGIACLERYVGNKFLVERAIKLLKKEKRTSFLYKFYLEKNLNPEVIALAAKKGDSLALKIWQEMAVYLATSLAGIINLLNPEAIIIGGGVSAAGIYLFKPLKEELKKRTLPIPGKRIKIVSAKLGNRAGVIGASVMAKLKLKGKLC